ncbi:hypothetical protein ACF1BU_37190 [Streptomyces sp. NPDC014724]
MEAPWPRPQLARGLGVTPGEVTAAYTPELRAAAIDELNHTLRL